MTDRTGQDRVGGLRFRVVEGMCRTRTCGDPSIRAEISRAPIFLYAEEGTIYLIYYQRRGQKRLDAGARRHHYGPVDHQTQAERLSRSKFRGGIVSREQNRLQLSQYHSSGRYNVP